MKIKIGVFFGGKSVEHEISIITMSQTVSAINKEKYDIIPIYISKKGVMYTGDALLDLYAYKDIDNLLEKCCKVTIINDGENVKILKYPSTLIGKNIINTIDIAFPIMHGTNGEDGTIAGYLNMLGLPFIGPDILASSIGMDKILMKKVLKESGLPVVDYIAFYSMEYIKDEQKYLSQIQENLDFPVIVKPGNLGSSVGIRKAKDIDELEEAIDFAMEFSDRIIVEKAITNLKEINCSVIGNLAETEASVCEEPIFSDEILSYTDKYIGGEKSKSGLKTEAFSKLGSCKLSGKKGMANSDKKLPADISEEKRKEIQNLAKETFKVLGCSGISRIDFLMDKETEEVYVNEINTIPGALSYYLWEASGKSFEEEIDEIIDIAFKRHRDREQLTFSYDQNIFAM